MTALDDIRTIPFGAPLFVHRNDAGRSYRGLPVLAAPGVHEFVAGWLEVNRPHERLVLEVGSGTGALTARLMDRNFEVVPVDSDAAPFTRCCPRFVQVDFNDPEWRRRLPDVRFETIVAVEIIGRLENPRKLIRDLYALCAPGGEVLVSVPNVLCASSLMGFLRKGMFYGFDPGAIEAAGQISILPHWLIERFARDAGFCRTEVMFIGDLERSRFKKALLRLANYALRRLRGEPAPVSAFGNVVLMRMVKDTE